MESGASGGKLNVFIFERDSTMAAASELMQGQDTDSLHAPSAGTDQRQLTAISPQGDVLAVTVPQALPTPGLPSPKTDFLSIYGALQRSSKVLTSALHRDVASAAPAGALKQLAREYGHMNDVLAALQRQLADAESPVERRQHEIWCPSTEQATRLPCIHDDEYWYERGDLLRKYQAQQHPGCKSLTSHQS
ncbi:hypothetical protein LTR32_003418 [Rachicladosporium monterosium]|uniref:Uncharacterized protein n=1 Tax=Rachicladosporium monterosium TaxID=1507873 RepID=A0ABR0L7I5_9PEZI|nr:hypothetical protein LTR32_003418 [Rachicladosporium monterosium]